MLMLRLTLAVDQNPIHVARDRIVTMRRVNGGQTARIGRDSDLVVLPEYTLLEIANSTDTIGVLETPEQISRMCGGVIVHKGGVWSAD